MNNKQYKIAFLALLAIMMIAPFLSNESTVINNDTNDTQIKDDFKNINIKTSGFWNNFTFIHITGANWSIAEGYDWCSGSGTWNDPYVLENITIDAGSSPTGAGITIENSVSYFIIQNCTVYNAGSVHFDAGLQLINADNGQILNNNFSNNNYYGLYVEIAKNLTIEDNIIENNGHNGMRLVNLEYSTFKNNTIRFSPTTGVWLDNCFNNTFLYNTIANHTAIGLRLFICDDNNITANEINFNSVGSSTYAGIYQQISDNVTIYGNNLLGNPRPFDNITSSGTFEWNNIDGEVPILYINDLGGGDFKWAEAAANLAWVSGSGSLNDPYLLEEITINGQNSSNCLDIRDSTSSYFVIRNNTFYNSSDGAMDAGLYVMNCFNGKIIGNNCSFNNKYGIVISDGDNFTINDNTANNNSYTGMFAGQSSYTNISGNTVIGNLYRGFQLFICNNQTFTDNQIKLNADLGLILVNCHNITIDKNTIENNGADGIKLSTSDFNNITNNNINSHGSGTNNGIHLDTSDNNRIIGNNLLDNARNWIQLFGTNVNNLMLWNNIGGVIAPNLVIDDNGDDGDGGGNFTWAEAEDSLAWVDGTGIQNDPYLIEKIMINGQNSSSCLTIRDSTLYFKIHNCTFYNASTIPDDAGIALIDTDNGVLSNNNCSDNNLYGIFLDNSENHNITCNDIYNNSDGGVYVFDNSHNNKISENTIFGHLGTQDYGIRVENSDSNNIWLNNISNNFNGIFLRFADRTLVYNNSFPDNTNTGIITNGADYNTIFNNSFISGATSLWLLGGSDHNIITQNRMINGTNIQFQNTASTNNSFTYNRLYSYSASWNGIRISSGDNITIFNNTIIDFGSGSNSMYIYGGQYHNISFNYITGFSDGIIVGGAASNTHNSIVAYNRLEGNNNAMHITMGTSGMRFFNNTVVTNTGNGIRLYFAGSNNKIYSNWIRYNGQHGITVLSTNFTLIYNNKILQHNGTGDFGIHLDSSNGSEIFSNSIYGNDEGISLTDSYLNNIYTNNISLNNYGVHLDTSQNNVISTNLIYNNSNGIFLENSNNTEIYWNFIFNNTVNAIDTSSINTYYHYFSNANFQGNVGNYWDNYTGSDANGDGIGDTSHIVWPNGLDPYPLMTPSFNDLKTEETPSNGEPEEEEEDGTLIIVIIVIVIIACISIPIVIFAYKNPEKFKGAINKLKKKLKGQKRPDK